MSTSRAPQSTILGLLKRMLCQCSILSSPHCSMAPPTSHTHIHSIHCTHTPHRTSVSPHHKPESSDVFSTGSHNPVTIAPRLLKTRCNVTHSCMLLMQSAAVIGAKRGFPCTIETRPRCSRRGPRQPCHPSGMPNLYFRPSRDQSDAHHQVAQVGCPSRRVYCLVLKLGDVCLERK